MTALGLLAENTGRGSGVRCVFECEKPVHVADPEVAGHLYRIAQEAVNNALKHAAPSEIRIGLERRVGALLLDVEDDGPGFEENARAAEGIGLRAMRYRARLIDGLRGDGRACRRCAYFAVELTCLHECCKGQDDNVALEVSHFAGGRSPVRPPRLSAHA